MPLREATELVDVTVGFVSNVDKGAHQDAHVVLHKRLDDITKDVPTSTDVHVNGPMGDDKKKKKVKGIKVGMTEDELDDAHVGKRRSVLKWLADQLGIEPEETPRTVEVNKGVNDPDKEMNMPEATEEVTKALAEVPDALRKYVEELQAASAPEAIAKMVEDAAEKQLTKMLGDAGIEIDADGDLVIKAETDDNPLKKAEAALDPVMKAEFDRLREESAKAVEVAKRTAEDADIKKFDDIVANELTYVPGDRAELSKALRTAAATSPEAYDTLIKSMRATNETMKTSELFQEIGKRNDTSDTPQGKVEALQKSFMAADPDLTPEKAFAKAIEANPALYAEMQKNKPPVAV